MGLEQIDPKTARLGTRRLILRAPEMFDAPSITACMNDLEVAGMLARAPFPYRLRHAREWLKDEKPRRAAGQAYAFAITRRDDAAGFCVGICSLQLRDDGLPHLGFWLGRPFWGQGLMTEAAISVVRFGFTMLGYRQIHSGYFADNEGSRRVHQKLGFAVIGEDMMYCMARGADIPHVSLTLTRYDWREPSTPVELVA